MTFGDIQRNFDLVQFDEIQDKAFSGLIEKMRDFLKFGLKLAKIGIPHFDVFIEKVIIRL
jgi:hypothetical protein